MISSRFVLALAFASVWASGLNAVHAGIGSALSTAASGATANQSAVDVIGNNLANQQTTSYKNIRKNFVNSHSGAKSATAGAPSTQSQTVGATAGGAKSSVSAKKQPSAGAASTAKSAAAQSATGKGANALNAAAKNSATAKNAASAKSAAAAKSMPGTAPSRARPAGRR